MTHKSRTARTAARAALPHRDHRCFRCGHEPWIYAPTMSVNFARTRWLCANQDACRWRRQEQERNDWGAPALVAELNHYLNTLARMRELDSSK